MPTRPLPRHLDALMVLPWGTTTGSMVAASYAVRAAGTGATTAGYDSAPIHDVCRSRYRYYVLADDNHIPEPNEGRLLRYHLTSGAEPVFYASTHTCAPGYVRSLMELGVEECSAIGRVGWTDLYWRLQVDSIDSADWNSALTRAELLTRFNHSWNHHAVTRLLRHFTIPKGKHHLFVGNWVPTAAETNRRYVFGAVSELWKEALCCATPSCRERANILHDAVTGELLKGPFPASVLATCRGDHVPAALTFVGQYFERHFQSFADALLEALVLAGDSSWERSWLLGMIRRVHTAGGRLRSEPAESILLKICTKRQWWRHEILQVMLELGYRPTEAVDDAAQALAQCLDAPHTLRLLVHAGVTISWSHLVQMVKNGGRELDAASLFDACRLIISLGGVKPNPGEAPRPPSSPLSTTPNLELLLWSFVTSGHVDAFEKWLKNGPPTSS